MILSIMRRCASVWLPPLPRAFPSCLPFDPPLAVTGGGSPVPFPAPPRPARDPGDVPAPHLQEVAQQCPHLRHGHPLLFFPPTGAFVAPGRPAPAPPGPCGGANLPICGSHIRLNHIPPWPTGCPPRSSSAAPAPAPASPAEPPPGRSIDDISTPVFGPPSAAPAAARAGRASRPP